MTATWFDNRWQYAVFTVEKENADEGWYYGLFQDGDEWGDYADLKADMYQVFPVLPTPPTT